MAELKLICWIRSEDASKAFTVRISKEDIVCDFQKAIKNENPVAFGNVDAKHIPLYKPNRSVEPDEESLSGFNLAEDAVYLKRVSKLSKVFSDEPAEDQIHIIMRRRELLVGSEGTLNTWFTLPIRPGETIGELEAGIKNARPKLKDVAHFLIYRIPGDKEVRESLTKDGDGVLFHGGDLAPNFLNAPVLDPLRVVIEPGEYSLTLRQSQEAFSHVNYMKDYKDIFLRVLRWEKLYESDIDRNRIEETSSDIHIPDFVAAFERKLLRKPCLPSKLLGIQTSDIPPECFPEYFEPYQDPNMENPQGEMRYADRLEVGHIMEWIVPYRWENGWKKKDHPLKERIMDEMFFAPFRYAKHREDNVQNQKLKIDIVVKQDDEKDTELRKFHLRSDFLVLNSSLPRLLVEVNSGRDTDLPSDLVKMLTTWAFYVRFANNFIDTYKPKRDFVLCALYVRAEGTVNRYVLFQVPDNDTVFYKKHDFSLEQTARRVEFARHFYNLLPGQSDEDQTAVNAISTLEKIKALKDMKSMYITAEERADGPPATKRRRRDSNGASGAGGRTGHEAQLRAHGYEVEPEAIVSDSGAVLEPLYESPDHIFTVFRLTNPDVEFIAKKVRKESEERPILERLSSMPTKSDHIVPLVDSFDGYIVVPKMTPIDGYIDLKPKVFESKVPQVCLGLVKGLVYLHELRIAHRDIKPDNLVVDRNFTLNIIDFDVAMQLKDEDQEVDKWNGMEGWRAPEVEMRLRHSPIRADRWACGWVIQFLLGAFGREDKPLWAFARDLVARDPKQRPSLVEWGRQLAPSSDASKASRVRRERSEVVDEIAKLPNVKRQRLEYDIGRPQKPIGLGFGCSRVSGVMRETDNRRQVHYVPHLFHHRTLD